MTPFHHRSTCPDPGDTLPELHVTLALTLDRTRVRATWREECPACGAEHLYQRSTHRTGDVLREFRGDAVSLLTTYLHRAGTWTNAELPRF